MSVFHLQPTNGSRCFPLVPFSGCIYCIYSETAAYIYVDIYLDIYMLFSAVSNGKRKTEAETIFLNPFTRCSSCKRKFVVCLFVDKETNESYLYANGLNGLNRPNGLTRVN